jgi:hypothetical protein
MSLTKINGNNIAQSTAAIISSLKFLNSSGNAVLALPSGTSDQRPEGVDDGTVRYNSDLLAAEIYRPSAPGQGSNWFPLAGGGPSIGEDSIIRTNANTIDENLTVGPTGTQTGAEFTNGMTAGPVTISSGFTVTVQNGASWSVR